MLMGSYRVILKINPSNILKVLSLVIGLTIFLGIVTIPIHDSNFGVKFDMDNENSIPAYISSLNLLLSAVILAFITVVKKKSREEYWRHWGILSFIFMLLSVDEMTAIHEDLAMGLGKMAGMREIGFGQFVWGVIGGILVLAFSAFYLRFLFSLTFKTRLRLIVAAAVFVGGALGVEVLSGYVLRSFGDVNLVYKGVVIVEESLEMLGILLFIRALLLYIEENMVDGFSGNDSKVQLSRKKEDSAKYKTAPSDDKMNHQVHAVIKSGKGII